MPQIVQNKASKPQIFIKEYKKYLLKEQKKKQIA